MVSKSNVIPRKTRVTTDWTIYIRLDEMCIGDVQQTTLNYMSFWGSHGNTQIASNHVFIIFIGIVNWIFYNIVHSIGFFWLYVYKIFNLDSSKLWFEMDGIADLSEIPDIFYMPWLLSLTWCKYVAFHKLLMNTLLCLKSTLFLYRVEVLWDYKEHCLNQFLW